MILEFETQAAAQEALEQINQCLFDKLSAQGFAVEDGAVIGKNAKTNADEPQKARTRCWDTVKQSPVGTFYFAKPNDDIVQDLGLYDLVSEIPASWFKEEGVI